MCVVVFPAEQCEQIKMGVAAETPFASPDQWSWLDSLSRSEGHDVTPLVFPYNTDSLLRTEMLKTAHQPEREYKALSEMTVKILVQKTLQCVKSTKSVLF